MYHLFISGQIPNSVVSWQWTLIHYFLFLQHQEVTNVFCTITGEKDLTGQLLPTERTLLNSAGSSGAGITYVAVVLTIAVISLDCYYL